MDVIISLLAWLLWALWSAVSWVLWQLLWILVWVVLPFALVAFVALRLAERVLGQEAVRTWVKTQSMKFGVGVWMRVRRLLFVLGVLPLRVLGWLALYTLWHSMISLFWRPRWSPWQRAWAKRWRPPATAKV